MNKMSPIDIEKIHTSFPLSSYLFPCFFPYTSRTANFGKSHAGNLPKIGNQKSDITVFTSDTKRPAPAAKTLPASHDTGLTFDGQIAPQTHNQNASNGALPSQFKERSSTPKHRSGMHNVATLNRTRQDCIMYLIVSADCVTQLRHVVMETCGDCVAFIRIQPIAHATRMKVWLGLSKPAVCQIMASVMNSLPGAEFGQVMPFE
ncbi:hypothetical protein QN379_00605 [Glaciimonas sp. Gout2]|uniref:hypothetical protein n=1 Tax=unclassified Glaciimonas TaxID=2644401 RepID=UPI002B221D51|nr:MULTISPECIES: hypothetical protein [unclassified Glaciimonas]MEB0012295.1 hypothetical protein [Glaciimonas sp. Cout2]MEB0080518.1 hypothetical protein [Glaciimonas sp. Gout2]